MKQKTRKSIFCINLFKHYLLFQFSNSCIQINSTQFNSLKYQYMTSQSHQRHNKGLQLFILPRHYDYNATFHVQLSAQQLQVLSTLLPKSHIFQIDNRTKRQSKSAANKKKQIEQPLQSAHNTDSANYPQSRSRSHPNKSKPKNQNKSKANDKVKLAISEIKKQSNNVPKDKKQKQRDQFDGLSETMKHCGKILSAIRQHTNSWPFLQPVDPVLLGIPQYFQIVKEPMDLSTIQSKLTANIYSSPNQFHNDVKKVIQNSYLFNHANPDFVKLTSDFQKYYIKMSAQFKPIAKIAINEKKKIVPTGNSQNINSNAAKQKVQSVSQQQNQQKQTNSVQVQPIQTSATQKPSVSVIKGQKKKKRVTPVQLQQISEAQPVTLAQKQELAHNIKRLAKQHLKGIVAIVFDGEQPKDTFDIQLLSQKKIRQLQKYVRNKIAIMEHTIKLNQQQRNENPDTNDLRSEEESFIMDSD